MADEKLITCEEAFRRLQDYLDRELAEHETEEVNRHLAVCEWCASEYRFERSVIEQVRNKLQGARPPEDLMSRISASLQGEGE